MGDLQHSAVFYLIWLLKGSLAYLDGRIGLQILWKLRLINLLVGGPAFYFGGSALWLIKQFWGFLNEKSFTNFLAVCAMYHDGALGISANCTCAQAHFFLYGDVWHA